MSSDSALPSLLIVGGTKTGKTHYGGQLLRRLEAKKHRLRMLGAPSDRTPFQEVLEHLAVGRSAPHTPTSVYRESVWHVCAEESGRQSRLVWPDYGGEQIEDIVRRRQVSEQWVQRIRESAGWLFFVRAGSINLPEDTLSRPRTAERMSSGSEGPNSAADPTEQKPSPGESGEGDHASVTQSHTLTLQTQAGLVELMQTLLFVKQVGQNAQLRKPPVVVVLSCWDEIPDARVNGNWADPVHFIHKRLPLLNQFITSTWEEDRFKVIGLSALGKALHDDADDDAFMDSGPERQGWCITEGGEQTDDLTAPVLKLMELMRDEG
jgi:hypothetical protein